MPLDMSVYHENTPPFWVLIWLSNRDLYRSPGFAPLRGIKDEMSRRQDPQTKKRLSYQKESRVDSGESRHGERISRPKRRALTHRAHRRTVRQALSRGDRDVDFEAADQMMDDASNVRLPPFVIWRPVRLDQHVAGRSIGLGKRAESFFGALIVPMFIRRHSPDSWSPWWRVQADRILNLHNDFTACCTEGVEIANSSEHFCGMSRN